MQSEEKQNRDETFNRDEDNKLVFETSEDLEVITKFEEMNLKEQLLRGNFLLNRNFRSRIHKSFSYPTARHPTNY